MKYSKYIIFLKKLTKTIHICFCLNTFFLYNKNFIIRFGQARFAGPPSSNARTRRGGETGIM